MLHHINLWPEEAIVSDGVTTVSVTIEYPDQTRTRLWYRLPEQYSSLIPASCDPFVVATIFTAMNKSNNLVVRGQVSPSLLQNLTEFQDVWNCWFPQRYKQIEISAEVEQEQPQRATSDRAISTFSGGVDSCFTAFRHKAGRCGRWKRNLQTGLIIHGFDIPLSQQQMFDSAAEKSKRILASLGVELIPMATNFKQLKQDWEDSHAAGLASCLMLLQGGYGAGLIPSSPPYQDIAYQGITTWGSNPTTDPLLSSNTFQIIHDGAGFNRIQKVEQIAQWSEALQELRVCWQGYHKYRNCGRCEKCIRTILAFRVVGAGLPECFEQDVTEQHLLNIKQLGKGQVAELEQILQMTKAVNCSDSWVKTLEKCIIRNRTATSLKAALKDRLQKLSFGVIRH